jgi:hypothetical protein
MLSVEKTQSKRHYKEDNGYKICPVFSEGFANTGRIRITKQVVFFPDNGKNIYFLLKGVTFYTCSPSIARSQ